MYISTPFFPYGRYTASPPVRENPGESVSARTGAVSFVVARFLTSWLSKVAKPGYWRSLPPEKYDRAVIGSLAYCTVDAKLS